MIEINNIKEWYDLLNQSDTYIGDLVSALQLTPQNEFFFWANLLMVLQKQKHPHSASKESEFKDEKSSLLDFIQHYCDLYDITEQDEIRELVSKLYYEIKNRTSDNYWNLSLQKLIDFFVKRILNNQNFPLLSVYDSDGVLNEEHSIYIKTLLKADAGYNFPIVDYINNTDVQPYWNINNDNYDEVRKHDQVQDIILNDKKIQYTRNKLSNWTRLLMPQYGRRVEIEDLDRNFWVIGQTIAAISAYLFDDDSPIPKLIEGLLRETTELWENVFNLWLEAATISQKKGGGVRVIVLPLPPRNNENGRHYDQIGELDPIIKNIIPDTDGWLSVKLNDKEDKNIFFSNIITRLEYLTHQYSNENLCIIPFIRYKNYKHNYYNLEYYPGIFFYQLSNQTWKSYPLQFDNSQDVIFSPNYKKMGNFSERIYGTNQEEGKMIWNYPYSATPQIITEGNRKFLYGNIRVVPYITASINNGEIVINEDSYFSVEDAAAEIVSGTKRELAQCFISKNTDNISYEVDFNLQAPETPTTETKLHYKDYALGNYSYYMGETASHRQKTASISRSSNLFNDEAYILKIGNYLPEDGYFRMASFSKGSGYVYTSMRGNVTKTRSSRASANTAYYRFNWNNYTGKNDGSYIEPIEKTDSGICFKDEGESKGIYKKSCKYPTENHLKYDGLLAVKKFIEVTSENGSKIYQHPAYFVTTVGLTPWQGGGRTGGDIYWDSAFVPGIFFYIPSAQALLRSQGDEGKEDIDISQYQTAYEDKDDIAGIKKPLEYTSDDPITEAEDPVSHKLVGEVKVEGEVVGKIVSYNPICRYEGYYFAYGDVKSTVYYSPKGGGRWRQFFVVNTGDRNVCQKVIINEGESDENIYYTATFSKDFEGEVKYFDVELYNTISDKNSAILKEDRCQVSEASIEITTSGYKQTKMGKIVNRSAKSTTAFNKIGNNSAKNYYCTGLPMILDDSTNKEKEENIYDLIKNLNNNSYASVFHGWTKLSNTTTCNYTYYGG